jgi:hypothetical protein
MEQYRASREIKRQLIIMQMSAGALSNKARDEISGSAREYLAQEVKRDRQAIIDAALKIKEMMVDVSLSPDARRVVSFVGGGMTRGIALLPRRRPG